MQCPSERSSAVSGYPVRRWGHYWLTNAWVMAASAIAVCLIKYGAGLFPAWHVSSAFVENWSNPHASPILGPPADYFLRSPVSTVAAGILGIDSARVFLVARILLVIVAIGLPFLLQASRSSTSLRVVVWVFVVGGPVPAIALSWVGSYDPVTIIGIEMAILGGPVASITGWALVGMNHLEVAVLGWLLVLAVTIITSRSPTQVKRLLLGGGAIGIGAAATQLLIFWWGGATTRSAAFGALDVSAMTPPSLARYWPLIAFSALGLGWAIVLAPKVLKSRLGITVTGLALVVAAIVPYLALDQTRVLALVLFPAALTTALVLVRTAADTALRLGKRLALAASVVPIPVIWVTVDGPIFVYGGWAGVGDVLRALIGG